MQSQYNERHYLLLISENEFEDRTVLCYLGSGCFGRIGTFE